MLYRIFELKSETVAFASAKALALYKGNLYINAKTRVSLTCDLSTGRTMRIFISGKNVLVASCTVPENLDIPVLDNWVIVGMSFMPVELYEAFVGSNN